MTTAFSLFLSTALPAPIAASALASSDRALSAGRSDPALALTPTGRLVFAAERGGAWSLFTAAPDGSGGQLLPLNASPARDPAISPDGKQLAFRSHQNGYWDIYTASVSGGAATRLTRGMLYSGAPAWSPDGSKIAFESYAEGDLDIWVMNADGTQAVDLTQDNPSQDYGPAWSPDGKWIAFTSWRTGTQQLFVVPPDCVKCKATNISQNKMDDHEPAWSPDGKQLAFVSDRDDQRAIYVADFSIVGLTKARRLTFSGWDDQPAWSPDGQWIAFVSNRPTRQPVYVVPAAGGIPRMVENTPVFAVSVTWAPEVTLPNGAGDEPPALYAAHPDLAASNSGHPFEMRRMTSTRLDPGINRLNGRVADSFIALQARVKQEVGSDFLGVLAEMARPLDLRCDITCDTLSWHKAGRAFDSRLDYADARGSALEIVREDQQGETYWRMFLRTTAQDGSLGEPLKEAPWDLTYRARWIVGRGEGGVRKPVPHGFYVDFTELAREYDWERISSHDDENYTWRTNKIAAEYWHYEQRDGLNWYQAMREVFSDSDLKGLAEWNALATQGDYDPYLLYLKDIPAPPQAWRWNALGP